MQKWTRPLLSFWQDKVLPWLLKAHCFLSEDYHCVVGWEYDESSAAAGHGTCIYCGKEVPLSILMGRDIGGRSSIEGFAAGCSRPICPKCGSADYELIVREDGKAMPEYIEVEKYCNQCGHTWGEMGFSPY